MNTNPLLLLALSLLLFTLSHCLQFNYPELEPLKNSSYGKNLIETIRISVEKSETIDGIRKYLNDLQYQLNCDLITETKTWKIEEIKIREKELISEYDIEELRKEILIKENELKAIRSKITKGESNLSQYKEQNTMNDKVLSEIETTRAIEEKEYQKSLVDHLEMVNALEEVIVELKKLIGSISGNGKPEDLKEICQETRDRLFKESISEYDIQQQQQEQKQLQEQQQEALLPSIEVIVRSPSFNIYKDIDKSKDNKTLEQLIKQHEDNKKAIGFIPDADKPIIANPTTITAHDSYGISFVQTSTKADQDSLLKLISLLEDIQSGNKEAVNKDQDKEASSLESYTKLKELLIKDNDILLRHVEEQIKHLQVYYNERTVLEKTLVNLRMQRTSKEDELKAIIEEKKTKEKQYYTDKKTKEDEIAIMKVIIGIFDKRLNSVSKFLKSDE